jgi:catechol 2,3-dioxygenase-like lactoylglutathione lyase family enzyme
VIREADTTMIVGDMEKAVCFYTDSLGLKLKARYGDQFCPVGGAKNFVLA